MINLPNSFLKISDVISKAGYHAYLVGGSSRDLLLGKEFHDIDIATDCPKDILCGLFKDANNHFINFGCLNLKDGEDKITITIFRKESGYVDHRHPQQIEFTDDLSIDYKRRDFTINAIYISDKGEIIDNATCLDDLRYCLIRTIGDSKKRLREDPLRILRAIRFSLVLDFEIEESLSFAILQLGSLLSELNKDKIDEEIRKTLNAGVSYQALKSELSKYNLLGGYDLKKFKGDNLSYDRGSN